MRRSGGAIFTFVLFIRYLPHLLEMIVRNSASLGSILEIVFFTLPDMFTVTIPMAVLVGILLGLSRLAADSEITAMRASGIGVWTFVRVVSLVAIAGWGVSMLDTLYLAPKAAVAMRHPQESLANAQASYEVQPRVFYEYFKDYVLYVQPARPLCCQLAGNFPCRRHQSTSPQNHDRRPRYRRQWSQSDHHHAFARWH